jgi:hypothetical protein
MLEKDIFGYGLNSFNGAVLTEFIVIKRRTPFNSISL